MARPKRNSSVLEKADRRIESLQSISVKLDFGEGLTIQAYNATINDLRSKLAAYNTALSSIDKLTDDVKNAEQAVIAMSEKMLLGVGSRYGKTSQEYEMAGGARRGNTKKKRNVVDNSQVTNSVQPSSVNGSMNGASAA
ncbi:hypothetical protein G1O98_25750 [Nostoc sp. UIC10630]|uniref:Uncharacterized protein n=4 Tax=Nostoc TaxID=1177 RepID=A0ABR8IEK0_9NOSO|nr:hypothetical protein [Nostoc sp. UIC 10630]MBD2562428.1 hypothetical protein [Nostoc linckia FACHB-391]MBD2648985.1 hypothetical protein [Nostoc foliaceum FACHB-393]NEU82363.1 hypothetical protein [Nostoc sp. UIC 10630]